MRLLMTLGRVCVLTFEWDYVKPELWPLCGLMLPEGDLNRPNEIYEYIGDITLTPPLHTHPHTHKHKISYGLAFIET